MILKIEWLRKPVKGKPIFCFYNIKIAITLSISFAFVYSSPKCNVL